MSDNEDLMQGIVEGLSKQIRAGRPPKPEAERKVSKGLRLSRDAWYQLEQIAAWEDSSQTEALEALIAGAFACISSPSEEWVHLYHRFLGAAEHAE